MTPEIAQFTNRGMNQDISVSKATNEFAFKNHNIRITAINDNTLLSITNEKLPGDLKVDITGKKRVPNKVTIDKLILNNYKISLEYPPTRGVIIKLIFEDGTSSTITVRTPNNTSIFVTNKTITGVEFPIDNDPNFIYYYGDEIPTETEIKYNSIYGAYLGHAIINEYLVLFTKSSTTDYIYVFTYDDTTNTLIGNIKYEGDLNFSLEHPIETLPYYESKKIQKVYWVDGFNQPRVINIVADDIIERLNTQFDFNPTVTKFPDVTITKEYSGIGLFPAGVIQYFISYYNKFGAETGIVWSSDLQYVTEYNRAAGPDENVVCSFRINIDNVDTTYEYARVYSMQRTSLNTTPICRIVADININNSDSISVIDTNTNTETIDPTQLLFLGGDTFIASTLAQKDDTLFLGDLTIDSITIPQEIKDLFIFENNQLDSPYIDFVAPGIEESLYLSNPVKVFKGGEWYRFAIQFQDNTTKWTIPIFIGDKLCSHYPSSSKLINTRYIHTPNIRFNKPSNFEKTVSSFGFINYRILIAETNYNNRKVLAQGFLNPTVFSLKDRITNSGPYAVGSWISRPINGNANYEHLSSLGNEYQKIDDEDVWTNSPKCEIQNTIKKSPIPITNKVNYIVDFEVGSFNGYGNYIANIWRVENKGDIDITSISPDLIISKVNSLDSNLLNSSFASCDDDKLYDVIIEFYQQNIDGFILNGLTKEVFKTYIKSVYDNSWNGGTLREHAKIEENTEWSSGSFAINATLDNTVVKTTNQSFGYVAHAYTYIEIDFDTKEEIINNNGYYVDSSLVTFHSPEIDNIKALVETRDLTLSIIGLVPINEVYSDISVETTSSIKSDGGLVKSYWDNFIRNTFLNAPVFQDYGWNTDGKLNKGWTYNYYVYLWNKKGSIIGQTSESKNTDGKEFTTIYSELKHKVIANKKISNYTTYLDVKDDYIISPTVFDASEIKTEVISGLPKDVYYQGNVDTIVTSNKDGYKVFWNDVYGKKIDGYTKLKQLDPVQIKYKKSAHLVFNLRKGDSDIYILPSFNDEPKWSLNRLYSDTEDTADIPWMNSSYLQNTITSGIYTRPTTPYLYLAEISRNATSIDLYGDYSDENLIKHNWVPSSLAIPISNEVTNAWGDTYYQRWECLNTVPSTEEDLNSVVDIVSFMIETHVNLEGRYDKNKDSLNILNARETNFNLINPIYSQTNNYFTYNILDEKFNQTKYGNQVAFSLQKTPTSEIDTWCNITLASSFNLNGLYGKLTKLINVNDAILAFQDKAVSVINFNNKTALSTESGVPIEIANSGKVNGYSVISSNVGCQNKQSICQASSGVYFIDDYNKAMYGFNKEGLSNISSKGMSMWFKKNLTGQEKTFYDGLTNDVYVTNVNDCLVFNEGLQSFTSFMDYNDINALFNFNGYSLMLDKDEQDAIIPKKMFSGDYTNNYSIEYKINPEPLVDKTFGNIEFIADCIGEQDAIDSDSIQYYHDIKPFDLLEVWNEYQKGTTDLHTARFKYPNSEKKFRTWRVDIPRANSNHRDRIRNPWIYLKLSKSEDLNNNKMVFHNLLVKYYK